MGESRNRDEATDIKTHTTETCSIYTTMCKYNMSINTLHINMINVALAFNC